MKKLVAALITVALSSITASAADLADRPYTKAPAAYAPIYNWTGFYMLDPGDPETLVLGPFVGAPTPHVRIPVSQGICGAAVASGKTVIVDDVSADPRYLSCSIDTRSEIVVPVYANGKVIGEIDIDSHDPAAFTDADRLFLEETAQIVGAYIEGHSDELARIA